VVFNRSNQLTDCKIASALAELASIARGTDAHDIEFKTMSFVVYKFDVS
jgi:hypothetical protein